MTPADLLSRELRTDPARPLITWYDDATGGRVELSVATAANWAAKVANLLVDDHDVEPGDDVAVRLPMHWQTAVVLLGVWTAGGCAVMGGDGGAAAVAIATTDADLTLTLDPMGADLSRAVAAQADRFVAVLPVDPQRDALRLGGRTWTHEGLAAAAAAAAAHHGVDVTSRILSTLDYDTADGLDVGLLMPLAAGGSVVLVEHADPQRLADRCVAERVTHTAGVRVPGVASV